jgi:hypothetical protein
MNVVMNLLENDYAGVFDSVPRDFGPCGAKYAFIDFGESHIVRTEEDAIRHPEELRLHPNAEAPELLKDDPVNLFSCDVYALGSLLRDHTQPHRNTVSNTLLLLLDANDVSNCISRTHEALLIFCGVPYHTSR